MPKVQQDRFQIFISHKHEDHGVASAIGRQLERLAPDIECWVSGEDITAASDWRREIRSALADSHLLVLLFTTPVHSWDWCLYEVGLFVRFEQQDDVSSVVCLYDPDGQSPGPLHNVQGVSADPREITSRFLTPLLRETWQVSDDWLKGPLAPKVSDKRLTAAGTAIADAFAGAIRGDATSHPCHRVVLDLAGQEYDEADGIPEAASVVEGPDATTTYTMSFFGRASGRESPTWGDLVEAVSGGKATWRRTLDEQFAAACRGDLFEPMIEPFVTWAGPRFYRPVLTDVVRPAGAPRPTGLTLVLVRDFAPNIVGNPAFNLVRSNTRFKSEVFDVYGDELASQRDARGRDMYREIEGALHRVERENEALGVFDPHTVRAAYGEGYEASGIAELEREWRRVRSGLGDALEAENAGQVADLFGELATLNQRFIVLAAARYHEVLAGGD
ncbi:MAG: toll/interleukin-1 receptor domain-containing protein [Ilumatobacteraceae bacterium]